MVRRTNEKYKFLAAIHGADIGDAGGKPKSKYPTEEEIENMSKEELDILSEQMEKSAMQMFGEMGITQG